MTDEEGATNEGVSLSMESVAGAESTAELTVVTASHTVGDQSFQYTDLQIRVETAAHQREMEKQRVQRELERDRLEQREKLTERKHQRFRENASYSIITALVVVGLIASFYVAVNVSDPTTKTWAQVLSQRSPAARLVPSLGI